MARFDFGKIRLEPGSSRFDESVDLVIVFKGKAPRRLVVHSAMISAKNSGICRKYMVESPDRTPAGYQPLTFEQFRAKTRDPGSGRAFIASGTFYADARNFSLVMSKIGPSLFKKGRELEIFKASDAPELPGLAVRGNGRTVSFAICKRSNWAGNSALWARLRGDLEKLGETVSAVYVKTTMGHPVELR